VVYVQGMYAQHLDMAALAKQHQMKKIRKLYLIKYQPLRGLRTYNSRYRLPPCHYHFLYLV
jgi:hypothetical protein